MNVHRIELLAKSIRQKQVLLGLVGSTGNVAKCAAKIDEASGLISVQPIGRDGPLVGHEIKTIMCGIIQKEWPRMIGEALQRTVEQVASEQDELMQLMRDLVREHDAKQEGGKS